jgi:integrase
MARAGRKDRGLLAKKDSTGKRVWYVRLYHEGKERRFGSFSTKTAARDFYEKAKQEQKTGRFFPERYQQGGYAKLEEVLDGYLAAFTGRSKRDEERFKKKWVAIFPAARLNALTPAALESARAQLTEGRTPQTVNRYMGFLQRVLNKAVRDGKLASNPVSRIKMFREPAGKTRFLSPEEEKLLCEKIGAPYAGWVRLAILTGMRQMEQFSLRWEHVDLERGVLTLPNTKAGGVQYVRLNEEAKRLIQGFIPGNKSVWVFPSENPDTHADPRNFYRRVYLPKVKDCGLDGVSWHSLRHTFASRLAMSGATEGTIATLLRHSGTVLVRRYAHLSVSHLQAEIEKVSAFGKVAGQQAGKNEPTVGQSEPRESVGEEEPVEGQPTLISVPTVTGTVTGATSR